MAPPNEAPQNPTLDENGAMVKAPKQGFDAVMELGAVPPTEIVFTASVAINGNVVKLKKDDPLPKDNFLTKEYKGKPFRNFDLAIHADPRSLNAPLSADGRRHGKLQFVTVLYTPEGETVNSITTEIDFDLGDCRLSQAAYERAAGQAADCRAGERGIISCAWASMTCQAAIWARWRFRWIRSIRA